MIYILQVKRKKFFAAAADDLTVPVVHVHQIAREINLGDAGDRLVQQPAISLLCTSQCPFDLFSLGDVVEHERDPPAFLAPDAGGVNVEPPSHRLRVMFEPYRFTSQSDF